MQRGLEWYKRDPIAFLGGVQGLTSKQISVYTVTLDLIYQHGGSINNDPAWVAGWIKDMGSASVRRAISELAELGKLIVSDDKISQKRAENEAKTKQKLSETRAETGRKGGEISAKKRASFNKNNDLTQANASSKIQPDKELESEKIPPAPAAPPPQVDQSEISEPKPKQKTGTRLSPDWQPSQADLQTAYNEGLTHEQAIRTADTFRDYWIAKSGAQATKIDWSATWRNWIRRDADDRQRKGQRQGNSPHENLVGGFARSAAKHEQAARDGRDVDEIPF